MNTSAMTTAKAAFDEGCTVCHIRNEKLGRTVAVRVQDDWSYWVQLSDGTATETIRDIRPSDLDDIVDAFFEQDGSTQQIDPEGGCFTYHINQADRDAEVVRLTKTRARIGYEMPNAGWMEGWQPYVKVCNTYLAGSMAGWLRRYCAARA